MADDQKIEPTLNPDEDEDLEKGRALYEMDRNNPGWQIVKSWLETAAFHSWVDPREIDKDGGLSKEEWMWRELNAFHAANNAKEILENIARAISRADYLGKVKSGEIERKTLKV